MGVSVFLSNRCRVTFGKRERKEWGKRYYTSQWDDTQKWIDTWGNKRRKWEARYKLWKGVITHLTRANWGQSMANCRFSQVSFDFLWATGKLEQMASCGGGEKTQWLMLFLSSFSPSCMNLTYVYQSTTATTSKRCLKVSIKSIN